MEVLKFPEGFKWGSATSAHQVEGGNHNDWTVWEAQTADQRRLDAEKRRNQFSEDVLNSYPSPFQKENYISGRACDSYNRYEEDFDIAKKLNQNIHRFSIEWSRIEPEEGKFNEKEIEHYKRLIDALRDRGIEPMVTLWHFTNPIWFAEKGGWLNKKSPEYFTRYTKYVVGNLKARIGLWITFNEAFTIYAALTTLKAIWPSRGRGVVSFLKTRRNIAESHILAYREIKKIYNISPTQDPSSLMSHNPVLQRASASQNGATLCNTEASHNVAVGITENNVYVPDTKNFWTTLARRQYKRLRNFYFFKKYTPYYDFIGLNYYHISRKPYFGEKNEIVPKQEIMKKMNWEIYPEGIYQVLKDLSKFKKPIFITENGIADRTDEFREKFIKDHLYWIWRAIQEGVDVRGYLYWSLLDNFEWAHGFGPRFGLVEIDYATLERRIRPSAYEYAKICASNSLSL